MAENKWYAPDDPDLIDSPALLVYPERIAHNIREMIRIAGSPDRLIPHVKTHKMSAVVKLQLEAGIRRFKCATIAEAEMLAAAGAEEVIMAYQLTAPKALRFLQLVRKYPAVLFASLVDNRDSAELLNSLFSRQGITAAVFIDVDNGMHRTGFPAEHPLVDFYREVSSLPFIHCRGFHVYDGHIHEKDFNRRKAACESAFAPVAAAVRSMVAAGLPKPEVIAGGTPTFPFHAQNPDVYCSPGTPVLWDRGYGDLLEEQPFLPAAVLMTRIISKPAPGLLTTDLGHKAVAAENPPEKRVSFLNLKNYKVVSQSEEHLVVEVDEDSWENRNIGDVLYALPFHVCPTVALFGEVQVVENGEITNQWKVDARNRKISI